MHSERLSQFRFSLLIVCLSIMLLPLVGCGGQTSPPPPDEDAINQYLQENPEAMDYGSEEDMEPDDGGDDGS